MKHKSKSPWEGQYADDPEAAPNRKARRAARARQEKKEPPQEEESVKQVPIPEVKDRTAAVLEAAGIPLSSADKVHEPINPDQFMNAIEALADGHEIAMQIVAQNAPKMGLNVWKFHTIRLRKAMLDGQLVAFRNMENTEAIPTIEQELKECHDEMKELALKLAGERGDIIIIGL